ncbi:hypothetical protein [Lacisediminihabitans sp.]|uniref:hypothetical protein n=1 Tax=Lacisediminihabitans sp. TaxID=2787631 RepID=UPI002F946991
MRVSLVEPGAVSSGFVANAGAGVDVDVDVDVDVPTMVAAAGAHSPALANYVARTTAAFSPAAAQTPAGAAAAIVELLLAETPALRIQASDGARAFVGRKLADLDGSAVFTETLGWVS